MAAVMPPPALGPSPEHTRCAEGSSPLIGERSGKSTGKGGASVRRFGFMAHDCAPMRQVLSLSSAILGLSNPMAPAMRADLEAELYRRYPGLFLERGFSPQETAMCWGIARGASRSSMIPPRVGW
jgi:hypothetical protein